MSPRPPLLACALLLSACSMMSPSEAPSARLEASGSGPGVLVVDLVDGTSLEAARAATGLELRWASERSADEALAVVEVADLAAADAAASRSPLVEVAEPSVPMRALGYPDDPLYPRQWHLERVGADAGWRLGGGAGVVVAVIDTGVGPVPDLDPARVLEGASVVPGVSGAADDQGHGTHVAGTIAQSTDNGLGGAGMAPRATILPIKALGASGGGTSEQVAAAIDEAVDQGARVINLSLGGPHAAVLDLAVEKATRAGVLVVAAAGNEGAEGVHCPAHAEGALAVSATGPDDTLAPYSSWGAEVALAAPGGDKRQQDGGVLQDMWVPGGHEFAALQGTSMATPHVSGALAVLLGLGLSPEEARERLLASARDLGESGVDPRYGHGRLDLEAALRAQLVDRSGARFGLGLALGFGFAALARLRRRWPAALAAGVLAGGLFFLPLLPLPPSGVGALLTRPFFEWPLALGAAGVSRFPLWTSALVPAALVFTLGPTRTLGPAVGALAAGCSAWLLHAGLTEAALPSLLPSGWGRAWMLANGALTLLATLAVAGVQRQLQRSGLPARRAEPRA